MGPFIRNNVEKGKKVDGDHLENEARVRVHLGVLVRVSLRACDSYRVSKSKKFSTMRGWRQNMKPARIIEYKYTAWSQNIEHEARL